MAMINKVKLHRIILLTLLFSFLLCGTCFAAEGYEKVAGDAQDKPVLKYGMVPIHGVDIKDGTYDVEALSSSSFFRLKDAKLTVKNGSMTVHFSIDSLSYTCIFPGTGEEAAKELGFSVTSVSSQANALLEVSAGTSDAAVIDLLMAYAMVGEGTGYANLTYTFSLNEEQYGVAFRKGSDLADALNDFFKEKYADGTMDALAEEYGLAGSVIEQ